MFALVIGLTAALWGSMKAFVGLQIAYDDTWEIPTRRPGDVRHPADASADRARGDRRIAGRDRRARLDRRPGRPPPLRPEPCSCSAASLINVACRLRDVPVPDSAEPTWSMVWPGAVFTGAIYTVIQMFGAKITTELAKDDSYGELRQRPRAPELAQPARDHQPVRRRAERCPAPASQPRVAVDHHRRSWPAPPLADA